MKNNIRVAFIMLLSIFQYHIIIAQGICYFKDIDLFTLHGINKLESKIYPCINIENINDTIKIVHFYQSDNYVHELTFKKIDLYWISYEAKKNKNCCDIDSVYIYTFKDKIIKFEYDEYVIAMTILKNSKSLDFYTFKRESIINRDYLINLDPTKSCELSRKINLTFENGILEKFISCYVCSSNRLYFEEKSCYDMRNLSLSWWFYLHENSFQKMSCD